MESQCEVGYTKMCKIWTPRESPSSHIIRLQTSNRLEIYLCLLNFSLCQWIYRLNKIGRYLKVEIFMGHISLEHLKHKRNWVPPKHTQAYSALFPKMSHPTSNKKYGQQASYENNAHCLHNSLLLMRKLLLMRTCSFLASGLKRHRS